MDVLVSSKELFVKSKIENVRLKMSDTQFAVNYE